MSKLPEGSGCYPLDWTFTMELGTTTLSNSKHRDLLVDREVKSRISHSHAG
jgi:hypothetical protein